MTAAELWVYLDDEDGRGPELPARMAAEGRRAARASGARVCGVVRHAGAAESWQSGGRAFDLDGLYALSASPDPGAGAASVASCLARAVEARKPQLLMLPATAWGAELGARVAAQAGRAFLSRCVDLAWQDGRPLARRAIGKGRAHQVVSPAGEPPWIVTLDPQILEAPAPADAPPPPLELVDAAGAAASEAPAATVWRLPPRDLGVLDADIVLSVGRGVSEAVLQQVHALSELLHAAVGGSREAVFGGLVPRERQVGASGKWIAPRVYVALGISGSTYHLMGIREARHVVAINRDPAAPIMARAEVGIVGNLEDLIPALLAAAANARAAGG